MDIKRKPDWFRKKFAGTSELGLVIRTLDDLNLHTVCEEAKCPNRNECYAAGQATFLIMGDVCSRNCNFCAIAHGKPQPLDPDEPSRIAQAAKKMALSYIVITSVTRDDLPDYGAGHFAGTIGAIKALLPESGVEALTPDFLGNHKALEKVFCEKPDVFNHNVETIPELYSKVRPQADYHRSLDVLRYAARESDSIIKSGFMVGLGETKERVFDLLKELSNASIDVVTIGQYLQPSPAHLPIDRFVHPDEFAEYADFGERELGFKKVFSGPLVRSSFMAKEIWKKCLHESVVKQKD